MNVNMDTADIVNTWIDSLQASFSGVQVCILSYMFSSREQGVHDFCSTLFMVMFGQ